ncbi:type II toxin-antitoxin system RelE family toxin [Desulfobacca acetoxidans]
MSYTLEVGPQAKKILKGLGRDVIQRLEKRLVELSQSPLDPRLSKPVKMSPGRRTSRVGDWRIIYRVNETDLIVFVLAICPRDKAYPKN